MKIHKITPRGNQVLVKPSEKKSFESEHGIVAPSSEDKEQQAIGEVLAVGEKVDDIKKGDHVLYGMFAGEQIVSNDILEEREYILLFDDDILAFVEYK